MRYLIVILFILFLGTNIAKSDYLNDCPTGYTQMIVNIPIDDGVDTCWYEVILCVKCVYGTYGGGIVEEIMVHAMRPLDTLCQQDPDEVMNDIVSTINNSSWVYQNIVPDCGYGWPPCNGIPPVPPFQINYSYPFCWQWDVFVISEDPYEEVRVKVAGCDCYCTWSKFFCWDGNELIEVGSTTPQSNCLECPDPETCLEEASPCTE